MPTTDITSAVMRGFEEREKRGHAVLGDLEKLPIADQFDVALELMEAVGTGEISPSAMRLVVNPLFDRVREALRTIDTDAALRKNLPFIDPSIA